MIYCIGNSHSHFFTGSLPSDSLGSKQNNYFTSISLGPTIAYNFYDKHLDKVKKIISDDFMIPIFGVKFSKEKDYVLLAIGEVDCRWHIPYQANLQGKNVDDMTKECLDRFFRCHLELKKNGIKTIAWGGHPSTTEGRNSNPDAPIFPLLSNL